MFNLEFELQSSTILCILLFGWLQLRPLGKNSQLAPGSLDVAHQCVFLLLLLFDHFLASCHQKVFQALLCVSCPSPRVRTFHLGARGEGS